MTFAPRPVDDEVAWNRAMGDFLECIQTTGRIRIKAITQRQSGLILLESTWPSDLPGNHRLRIEHDLIAKNTGPADRPVRLALLDARGSTLRLWTVSRPERIMMAFRELQRAARTEVAP